MKREKRRSQLIFTAGLEKGNKTGNMKGISVHLIYVEPASFILTMKVWMKRTLVCLTTLYLFLMYSPILLDIKPKAYSLPFRNFSGSLAENHKLDQTEHLFEGILEGPESIVFHEGALYTGLADGRIVRIEDGKIITVARTGEPCELPHEERKCGRPLGMRKGKDGLLYICDAFYGIFTMNFTTGALQNILPSSVLVAGHKLNFPDDLDIDNEGNIYFTDASTKWDLTTIYYLMYEYEAGGRVIKYNIHSGETKVLVSNLNFPNGVQLSRDGNSLLICEIMNRRILRLYIKGKQEGKVEVFADALPAEPDNIRPSSRGYWVGFTSARNSTNPLLSDIVAEYTTLKRLYGRIHSIMGTLLVKISEFVGNTAFKAFAYKFNRGDFLLSLLRLHGIVMEFNENGEILRSFHSPDGSTSALSEVGEHEGFLYLGSFVNPYLGRLKL
ncbi:adipocyte plasma membrane-associated protein [Trichonephila clavata]|uniref:Adipocyte plasma membrane-associated protein n=1 Tax=Trichonephila clavata TaxID=2740835 RepID=A0A8X6JAX1_TRICU|nr:adipocyte plasma membrane-associated protein [Trichonephila clavata]